jgi:hypothetical protein
VFKQWIRVGLGITLCTSLVTAALSLPAAAAKKAPLPGITLTVKKLTKLAVAPGFVALTGEASLAGNPVLDPSQSDLASFMAQLGPANLRIGGQTSELNVAWEQSPSDPLPSWASSSITPEDLTAVANLAKASGWSVDLGVNLNHYSPSTAANEVQVAQAELGSSLHDVEIGNEPELYDTNLFKSISFPAYIAEVDAYRTAIKAVDPGVTFAGPDFYLDSWLSQYAGTKKAGVKGLSEFTQHFYPLADCNAPVSASDLFAETSIFTEDQTISQALAAAKKGHIPLVLDELNSVSCGSSSPVIYQFASALWAVHALLEAAAKGVASVDIQMTPGNCLSYTPVCEPNPGDPSTLQANPIFYGMKMVSGLEGGTVTNIYDLSANPLPDGVSDYAVRQKNGDTAVIVDNTTDADVTQLNLSVDATAHLVSVQSLQAPSLDATTGVTLTTSTPASSATTGLTVPADSAVVFTVAP